MAAQGAQRARERQAERARLHYRAVGEGLAERSPWESALPYRMQPQHIFLTGADPPRRTFGKGLPYVRAHDGRHTHEKRYFAKPSQLSPGCYLAWFVILLGRSSWLRIHA